MKTVVQLGRYTKNPIMQANPEHSRKKLNVSNAGEVRYTGFAALKSKSVKEKLTAVKKVIAMSDGNSFKVGCANEVIEVNLFTELSGYGGFRGRRNRGIHDNLHCRVASFNVHGKRFILITNELIFMDRKVSREIRERLSNLYALHPMSVMI